jgi:hypothetical protein
MAFVAAPACSCCCNSNASQLLPRPKFSTLPFPSTAFCLSFHTQHNKHSSISVAAAKKDSKAIPAQNKNKNNKEEEVEEVEVEEELPWIQEKALDVVEFTGSVTQAIPGPRVGTSSLPWILAVPLAYAGLTFVIAFVKTVKKFSSPKEKRKRLVCLLFSFFFIFLFQFQVFVCSGIQFICHASPMLLLGVCERFIQPMIHKKNKMLALSSNCCSGQ